MGGVAVARLSWIAAVLLAALPTAPVLADDLPVDLELVLAVDVSGSMDSEEQRLQREGYLEALVHEQVLNSVMAGPSQRIALTYVEWAGAAWQSVVVPWRLIDGPAAAKGFAAELARSPFLGSPTPRSRQPCCSPRACSPTTALRLIGR